jgi:hypothetical protein
MVTTSESTETIQKALSLFNNLLDDQSFYSRGTRGPQVILSDDSSAERQALSAIYPESTLILCAFHVLQAHWRFLWDGKNAIAKDHRPHLFGLMKGLLYSDTVEDLDSGMEKVLIDAIVDR